MAKLAINVPHVLTGPTETLEGFLRRLKDEYSAKNDQICQIAQDTVGVHYQAWIEWPEVEED
jgi:hypothetical protein